MRKSKTNSIVNFFKSKSYSNFYQQSYEVWNDNKNTIRFFYSKSFFKKKVDFYENKTNKSFQLLKLVHNHIIYYPTPINLSYFWNFGFLALVCLLIQVTTGVFLAMHYIPHVSFAFNSVEHIMRDVNKGWFVRYFHANGASAFFAVVYFHILKGFIYKSYSFSNKTVWFSGILIFILMMATAFVGYVLPWGQMSFWGATVITNLFSVIPFIGTELVYWLWGGFSVGASTLTRFYSFHYLLPFIIIGIVFIHIFYLHNMGSSNSIPVENREINSIFVSFYPFFFLKDLIGLITFFFILFYFIFFNPNVLGHSDNYIEANSLVTPEHIVPEWYFLPFYAILRSIPNKEIGIITMAFSIFIFFFIPFFDYFFDVCTVTPLKKKKIYEIFFFKNFTFYYFRYFIICCFISIFIILGFIGSRPVEYPYIELGIFFTKSYFFVIFILSFMSALNWEHTHNFLFFNIIKIILQKFIKLVNFWFFCWAFEKVLKVYSCYSKIKN